MTRNFVSARKSSKRLSLRLASVHGIKSSLVVSLAMDSSSSSSHDPTETLRNATFARSGGVPVSPESAVTASDLLLGQFDPTKLHPMAGLEDKLDYLLLDDDKTSDLPGSGTAIPSRGWSDDLCYGTGTMYLSGASLFSFCHSHSRRVLNARPLYNFIYRHSHLIVDVLSYCLATSHVHRHPTRSRPRRCVGFA